MQPATITIITGIALILLRLATEQWLAWLNRRHVLRHAGQVPEAFRGIIDPATYAKSVQYTLARSRFGQAQEIYGTALLLAALFSGVLPWAFGVVTERFGASAWAAAVYLFAVGIALSLPSFPFDWYAQFRVEERFGFNTTTPKTWWMDRLKGLLLAIVIGWPLLVLILKIVEWTGERWWLWAWGVLMVFQLVMLVLAPVLILPLFNKFTPLPEGLLKERLLRLADRTSFRAQSIQVMDGSKRSRHSNAFFTGFGGFRKIVLFDTLIQQLSEPELEAVLAHEIGHYKRKHIPKMLAFSALSSLLGFYAVAVLARQDWFYRAFGFEPGKIAPALLLFALLSGVVTFWFSPLAHWWSRRHEYEADAYAAKVMNESQSLIGALRKLNEKNLSNLTPHPLYSGFYYSHPAMLERERALAEFRG
ncbi:MAG TPA: M48 family metallopeptidase [Candidatus Paceibacterota bacterium]|nr:M48 family metallopeptidase [Candidatus Paceibacterota bacterium]